MIDDPSQSEEKALRVEGRGCVFGRQVVFGYPPRNRDAGAIQGVHEIGGTPVYIDANNAAINKKSYIYRERATTVAWLPFLILSPFLTVENMRNELIKNMFNHLIIDMKADYIL
jgi:hypothetical protein